MGGGGLAVPCPGCGREYDVTLFAFGRTLHCACGRRVGLSRRLSPAPAPGAPRFFADAMLGRVATWLRLLGLDCAFEPHVADADLVRRAVEEGRCILTRDRRLPEEWRVANVFVVAAERPFEQLREVVQALHLGDQLAPFTRCARCNEPLVAVSREEARRRAPPRIAERHDRFRGCPACGRLYWEGSHVDRMRRIVASLGAGPGQGADSESAPNSEA